MSLLRKLGNDDSVVAEGVRGSSVSVTDGNGVSLRNDRSELVIADNRGRLRVGVGDGNWVRNVLDNRRDLGVSVTLSDGVGKVSAKTIRLDDSAVVLESADRIMSRDQSLSGSQEDQENSQLKIS